MHPETPPHTVSPVDHPTRTLAVVDQGPPERADAARNRARLLEAGARMVEELGAENVTMEAVAAAASVGKGTVYRRFGDRAGLMAALVDDAERSYQESFLSGPAPLGPGAPPEQRLRAFGIATIRHEIRHRDVLLEARREHGRRHAVTPALGLRATHLSNLLREADVAGDLQILTEVLLSYLSTGFVNHLHTRRGVPAERIEAGWNDLVDRVLCPASKP
ncbi:TetR family transcriptional regulator [Actinopolymorpha pittospori]|uniref:AcrR family transcriptional regulator n=1 Tax=Actinopolymorpha pittospori TaxID=648752 RepID=A0A927N670_9ACTN|nr:AcrR family transcriptional regulator [Actinopolymorpha pittospori]